MAEIAQDTDKRIAEFVDRLIIQFKDIRQNYPWIKKKKISLLSGKTPIDHLMPEILKGLAESLDSNLAFILSLDKDKFSIKSLYKGEDSKVNLSKRNRLSYTGVLKDAWKGEEPVAAESGPSLSDLRSKGISSLLAIPLWIRHQKSILAICNRRSVPPEGKCYTTQEGKLYNIMMELITLPILDMWIERLRNEYERVRFSDSRTAIEKVTTDFLSLFKEFNISPPEKDEVLAANIDAKLGLAMRPPRRSLSAQQAQDSRNKLKEYLDEWYGEWEKAKDKPLLSGLAMIRGYRWLTQNEENQKEKNELLRKVKEIKDYISKKEV